MRLTIYREILPYVPRFRDKLFVIAVDGAVVEDDNFRNLLRDIALLRTLSIKVALVHGAAHQVHRLAGMMNVSPSNLDGSGVTDAATLRLALLASSRVSWELLEGLSAADLRGAVGNALVAHPAGILQGIDHQHTGKVERIDTGLLQALLERDIVPVIPPVGSDGEGHSYRLNSDAVAVEVARAMGAVKLIYLTTHAGLPVPGEAGEVYRHLKEGEAEHVFKRHGAEYPPELRSKLEQAIKAVRGGVPRVHLIDGRVEEGLLGEVFSNEGIGTLIHTSEYQEIRQATRRDVRAIHALMQGGVERDELVRRPRAELERQIDDYFVFEVDKTPAGCAALHVYPDEEAGELAAVCVDGRFENQGIGGKLMRYVEGRARAKGLKTLFCLSTQAFNYFQQKGGFTPGTPDDLPPARRERYEKSGRRSVVLLKRLG
ncbi:MAG: amino-acid N-acetyltransferase [Gemmataceae bacterium]